MQTQDTTHFAGLLESVENLTTIAECAPPAVNANDLLLERDGVSLEQLASGHLKDSIANCESIEFLIGADASIDAAMAELEARKRECSSKIALLSISEISVAQ